MANMRAKHARLNAGSNVWGVSDMATKMLRSEAAKRGAKTRKVRAAKIAAAKAAGKEKARARRERRAKRDAVLAPQIKLMVKQGTSLTQAAKEIGIGTKTASRLLRAA